MTKGKNTAKSSKPAAGGTPAVPSTKKDALNRFKMEAAREVGINLKPGDNGDLTARQAGSIGGQMVKKMIQSYAKTME